MIDLQLCSNRFDVNMLRWWYRSKQMTRLISGLFLSSSTVSIHSYEYWLEIIKRAWGLLWSYQTLVKCYAQHGYIHKQTYKAKFIALGLKMPFTQMFWTTWHGALWLFLFFSLPSRSHEFMLIPRVLKLNVGHGWMVS